MAGRSAHTHSYIMCSSHFVDSDLNMARQHMHILILCFFFLFSCSVSFSRAHFFFFHSDFVMARQNVLEAYHRDSATGSNGRPTLDTQNTMGVSRFYFCCCCVCVVMVLFFSGHLTVGSFVWVYVPRAHLVCACVVCACVVFACGVCLCSVCVCCVCFPFIF